MATPYSNSVPITQLSLAGLAIELEALIDGAKWGAGGYGTGVDLTYSFPWLDGQAYAPSDYGDGEWSASFELNGAERAAVDSVLGGLSRAADITFTRVPDDSGTVGELRFTGAYMPDYAHAYVPFGDYPEAGDVWFSTDWLLPEGSAVEEGSYEYMTIVHEVGHALGLRHPFDEGYELAVLAPEHDNYLWTVMSYSAYPGADPDVWADFYPTTLMYLDLVALETLYGPSRDANPGNTRYVFRSSEVYWETISDSGGTDTIVYQSPSRGGFIDLSNAEFSRMGRAVHFSDGTSTRDTIGLGPSTRIENATGGRGDDELIGNYAANRLRGNAGDDTLSGGAGRDALDGGAGADWLRGGGGADVLGWTKGDSFDGGRGTDVLRLVNGDLDLTRIGDARIRNIERIDLGGGDNTLTLAASDVLALSGTTNRLTVIGGPGDSVVLRDSFQELAPSAGYTHWKSGAAILKIDDAIDVV